MVRLTLIKTKILKIDPLKPEETKIKEATNILKKNGLLAFPTETVYGLGANAFSSHAVKRVFQIKKRPLHKPLTLMLAEKEQIYSLVKELPPQAIILMDKFWPGPLTLILKASADVPSLAIAGGECVGLRIPQHPIPLALIKEFSKAIVATSANTSGATSPINARQVMDDLNGLIDMIIDGGESCLSMESTVIDLCCTPPRLLRSGALDILELKNILGEIVIYEARKDESRK